MIFATIGLAFAGETFEAVKKHGHLVAGVNTGAPGAIGTGSHRDVHCSII